MTGKAGEYAVAAQLLIRGVKVHFPASDYGVDLLANETCRIQVKSAHISTSEKMVAQHGEGAYLFPLKRYKRMATSNDKSVRREIPKFVEFCDFVVFWGIEQNRFWIVPAWLCDQRQLFALGRTNPPRFVGNIADVLEMVKLGYTHAEIAKKYGIDRASLTMLINRPGFDSQEASVVSLVRNCENAWENIINFEPAFTGSEQPQLSPFEGKEN